MNIKMFKFWINVRNILIAGTVYAYSEKEAREEINMFFYGAVNEPCVLSFQGYTTSSGGPGVYSFVGEHE